jgi:predicted phosphodiesterase
MGVKTAALARAGLAGSVEGAGETVFWKAWPVIKRDALPYDLHFGRDFAFRPQGEKARYGGPRTLTECLVNDLTFQGVVKDIAAVIITGDFMTAGDWSAAPVNAALAEFDALHKALDLTPQQIIAVPGNHDIVRFLTDRLSAKDAATSKESEAALISDAVDAQVDMKHEQPFREFVAKLTGRHEKASFNYVRRIELNDVDLLVCALNSCVISGKTNLIQYRYVGDGKAAIKQLGQEELRRPTYRFLALHHHLLPVAAIEYPSSGGVSLTLDASEILPDGQRAGVNVVLHGHQHQPKVTEYRAIQLNRERESADENLKSLYVVANGSASVNSDNNHRIPPGYVNTYCLFKLTAEKIELVVREFRSDGGRVESQLDQALDSKPGTPTKATNPA